MAVKSMFVVGSGLMGSGIAQVSAQAGIEVFLTDMSEAALEKAKKNIAWSVGKFADKGKISEDVDTVMNRITTVTGFEAAKDVDLAIEVVFENLEVKEGIFKSLDEACGPDALIASNTSAIPITELAAVTKREEKVLGIHFFSPVPMMMAVEVIKGVATTDETAQAGREYVLQIGKEPIMVNRDIAGFVINRINFPSNIEAMRLVEQGVASLRRYRQRSCAWAFGPQNGAFSRPATWWASRCRSWRYTNVYLQGRPKILRFYPPLHACGSKVLAGHLGRKTGKGWYEYNEDGTRKK